jgi:hypothetical protein
MRELDTDELFLKGRVQAETALDALAYSGLNLDAQKRLKTFLDVHETLSYQDDQDDLVIYLRGERAETEKADIIVSLAQLAADPNSNDGLKLAATALHQILT